MPLPRDIGQLVSALRFRPAPVDTAGLRIAIAARMPERYHQPSVFLNATLRNTTSESHPGKYPVYRFFIDETTQSSEPVQLAIASARERQEQTYQTYDDCSDDDPVKQLVRQEMGMPIQPWLEFRDSDWIVAMGDRVTIHTTHGWPEPLGEIFQLTVLK